MKDCSQWKVPSGWATMFHTCAYLVRVSVWVRVRDRVRVRAMFHTCAYLVRVKGRVRDRVRVRAMFQTCAHPALPSSECTPRR